MPCYYYIPVLLIIGLNTETLSSSLTNLSNQSANAAINSLDQFFSSLSSVVSNRGAQLFSQLEQLKVSDIQCMYNV